MTRSFDSFLAAVARDLRKGGPVSDALRGHFAAAISPPESTPLPDCVFHSMRDVRKAMGMTQQDLAEHLGMSKQSVSGWESGRCTPSPRIAIAMTKVLRGLKFEHIYPAANQAQGRAAA